MHVCAERVTGVARVSDHVALIYVLTDGNQQLGIMPVNGRQTVAMVDHNIVSITAGIITITVPEAAARTDLP